LPSTSTGILWLRQMKLRCQTRTFSRDSAAFLAL
jgi:hypothetical protein